MLDKNRLINDCMAVVGWPYESPGTNDMRGIDCSGMLVRAYRIQGASIYHGSNRIAREYCTNVKKLYRAEQLEAGMAVFKWSPDGLEGNEYKKGGKYYNRELDGNFYHIGLVTNREPLKIVHCTTPVAKVDTALGNWSWCGYLKAVNYNNVGNAPKLAAGQYKAHSDSGATVNLRSSKYVYDNNKIAYVPIGDTVTVTGIEGIWAAVEWQGKRGFIMTDYLLPADQAESEGGEGDPDREDGFVSVRLTMTHAAALADALRMAGAT
ncbi:hypothetical protein FACS1894184_21160 [Clostridia bacterium]|nr:hypothetical protein FACS1894184_21160 [Clostridia bacterium]